jgi:hypothetical protein
MNKTHPRLNLPEYSPKIRVNNHSEEIFDPFRKKWLQLLPEEWVRQHFLNFMTTHLGYPPGLIKVEYAIQYNTLTRRPDAVVFNRQGREILIVECKAPHVELTQDVLLQVIMYNKTLQANYFILTNGMQHIAATFNKALNELQFLETVPHYNDICL